MRGIIMKMFKILLLVLLLVGCSNMTYEQISMDEGLELMSKDDSYILLDVRTYEEYNAGHIPSQSADRRARCARGDRRARVCAERSSHRGRF